MEAEYSVASSCMGSVLHGRFAKRRMNCSELSFTGGCDYVTGEASFEEEASDQGRHTGVRGRRIDFLASGRRIGVGCAGGRCAADGESRAEPGAHVGRRGNRRRQFGDVPSLRQGEHGRRSRWRTVRQGLWMRRLPRLPRLRRLPRLPRLRLRWMRRLRILLPLVGLLPHLLSRCAGRLTRLTNEYRDGRVRQCRPGHSMSGWGGGMRIVLGVSRRVANASAGFPIFLKSASARTGRECSCGLCLLRRVSG